MPRYCLVLFGLVVAPLLTPAFAQQPPLQPHEHKWEVSIFAGSSHRGDGVYVTPFTGVDAEGNPVNTTANVGLDFAAGYIVGGRVTENLGKYFGAELEYSLANQPTAFINLSESLDRVDVDMRVHQITYSVLVYGLPKESKWRPYGAVGPGVALFEFFGDGEDQAIAEGLTLKDKWKFGATFGGGVKYRFVRNAGLRFDVRDFMSGVPSFGLPSTGTEAVPGFRPDGRLHAWQFTIGLSYLFQDR